MQVKFLLNEKTRHRQIYNHLSVSANRFNTKTQTAPFKISEKSVVPDKKEITETIILLEHIVKILEKKVHDLREYTNSLKTVPPSARVCRERP